MQGAFGKPLGTLARVHFGQVIVSLYAKLSDKEHVTEALHGATFKFLAVRSISRKWGFPRGDAIGDMLAEKWLIPDGCRVKYILNHGPLDTCQALYSLGLPLCSRPHQIIRSSKSPQFVCGGRKCLFL